jgi:hypothetical protein
MAGMDRDPENGGVVTEPWLYLARPIDHRKGKRQT